MATKEQIIADRSFATERYILSTLPTLYISMRRNGSTFLSDDGTGYTCTVVGALPTLQGRSFDGDDKITIPHHAALDITTGDFSFGGWANVTSVADYRTITWKADDAIGTATGYFIRIDKTTGFLKAGICDVANGETYLEVADAVNHINTGWHFYFATVDRDSAVGFKLYVDNALVATGDPTAQAASLTNTHSLYIGIGNDGSSYGFYGTLGDNFLYKGKALGLLEIQPIYLVTKWRHQ